MKLVTLQKNLKNYPVPAEVQIYGHRIDIPLVYKTFDHHDYSWKNPQNRSFMTHLPTSRNLSILSIYKMVLYNINDTHIRLIRIQLKKHEK